MAEMDGRYLSLAVWRNRAARELLEYMPVKQSSEEPRSHFNVI
jgi:erythromycin esterase-like protein